MNDDTGCLGLLIIMYMAVIFCALFSNACYDFGVSNGMVKSQADAVRKGVGRYRIAEKSETGEPEFVWLVPVEEGPTTEVPTGK